MLREAGLLVCGAGGVAVETRERGPVVRFDWLGIVVELAFRLLLKFAHGVQEQAINVSDDGGAARGDAALGEQVVEGGGVLTGGFDGVGGLELANERPR